MSANWLKNRYPKKPQNTKPRREVKHTQKEIVKNPTAIQKRLNCSTGKVGTSTRQPKNANGVMNILTNAVRPQCLIANQVLIQT